MTKFNFRIIYHGQIFLCKDIYFHAEAFETEREKHFIQQRRLKNIQKNFSWNGKILRNVTSANHFELHLFSIEAIVM